MDDTEKITERKQRIQGMFNGIARRYDLLNRLLSGGVDVYWRRKALAAVRRPGPPVRVLDLATGTGDLALALKRSGAVSVVGVDVALNMVRLGVGKVERAAVADLRLMGGDAEALPFAAESFDLVTAAFGVRNFGHIPAGLTEAWRVLKPGGELVVLDFAEPEAPLFRSVYRFYFQKILPKVGGIISGDRSAYAYLPRSVDSFPQGRAFLQLLEDAGFAQTRATPLTLGISSIYQGIKPGA